MIPTEELRIRLRKLLDEKVPTGGTGSDTRFEDEDLDSLINDSTSIYEAAAVGWMMKAGMYQAEMGEVESTSTGQESYKLVTLKDRQDYALKQAKVYGSMVKSAGSFMLKVTQPEVL